MTLRNEIFEGLAAWKGVNDVTGNNPRDRYYETLARTAKIPLDEYDARQAAKKKAIGAGRPGGGMPAMPQALASTATPGTPPTAYYAEGGYVPEDNTDLA